MPVLMQALKQIDQGHVRIITKLWNLEGIEKANKNNIEEIIPFLLDFNKVADVYKKLPHDAQIALGEIIQNQGKIPWSLFTHKYGTVPRSWSR